MPIIRKMVQVGASKGVTLPKSWIEDAENTHGQKIEAIAMEINGLITLSPVFDPKTKKLKGGVAPDQENYTNPSHPKEDS